MARQVRTAAQDFPISIGALQGHVSSLHLSRIQRQLFPLQTQSRTAHDAKADESKSG